jgi:putative colanic acid biosynthesis UDP-glucose lipid carrier transferase
MSIEMQYSSPLARRRVSGDIPSLCAVGSLRDFGSNSIDYRLADLEHRGGAVAGSKLKRALDIVGALAGLTVLAPLFLVVALAIMIDSRGWPLFFQRRSGYLRKPFVIWKFRTMRVCEDGDTVTQACRDDARITRVGAFLRRTSIDELPQLVNVLKGDMSLVGPRPHALAHDEFYGACVPRYASRFKTRPGLTGLAQISGFRGQTAEISAMAARIERDLDYILRWSILLDLEILFKTALSFPFHHDAY